MTKLMMNGGLDKKGAIVSKRVDEKLLRDVMEMFYKSRPNAKKDLKENVIPYKKIIKVFKSEKLTMGQKRHFLYHNISLDLDTKDILWERFTGDRCFINKCDWYKKEFLRTELN